MTDDPYIILGVPRHASDQEVRDAYRDQAKANHPDKHFQKPEIERNAYEQQFKRVQAAYAILSDPDQRAYFDKHGQAKQTGPQPPSAVERTLVEMLATLFNPQRDNLKRTDYVGMLRHQLTTMRATHLQNLRMYESLVLTISAAHGRFLREKDPENPFAHLVNSQTKQMEQQAVAAQNAAEHMLACLAELEKYQYVTEDTAQEVSLRQFRMAYGLNSSSV